MIVLVLQTFSYAKLKNSDLWYPQYKEPGYLRPDGNLQDALPFIVHAAVQNKCVSVYKNEALLSSNPLKKVKCFKKLFL